MTSARRRIASVALLAASSLTGALLTAVVTATPAAAAVPVPRTPSGLPRAIEASQPYVGQSTCDPVAKPGVAAFRDLILATYPQTSSLGIVRDCGSGGQSEHKEGRAWDWGVSVSDPADVARVNAVFSWLMATDQYGNTHAMLRRLGIMYMIWNHRIWKAYDPAKGWQTYSGADPHTGHVHFSFGWNGAHKVTSYWDGTVAPIEWGPTAYKVINPLRSPANINVLATYGSTVLSTGSSGPGVVLVQKVLELTADGSYGSQTASAVERFKASHNLPVNGVVDGPTWRALFPPPIDPFGALFVARNPTGVDVTGWVLDADTAAPLDVTVTVDGVVGTTTAADQPRPDVGTSYPSLGPDHGFGFEQDLPLGSHEFCVSAANAPGSPGKAVSLGCKTVVLTPAPAGALERANQVLGAVQVRGWAVDPDTTDPVVVHLTVDDVAAPDLLANVGHGALPEPWSGYGATRGFATDLTGLTEGSHTVCASAVDVAPADTEPVADTPLGCTTVDVKHTPSGAVEKLQQVPGGVLVSGWAADPDTVSPTTVNLTVDGRPLTTATASGTRTDLRATLGAVGTAHGWTVTRALSAGSHTVCAAAANVAGTLGAATHNLGCLTTTVVRAARGGLLVLRNQPGSTVRVQGWALDPDISGPSSVAVTVDGKLFQTRQAGTAATLPAAWSAFGGSHGFLTALDLRAGTHTVCVTALNAAGTEGGSTPLGCRSVLVGVPVGHLDSATGGTGWLTVKGWAIDPDTSAMDGVAIYLDGRLVAKIGASGTRTDLATRFPGYGSRHGFVRVQRASRGTHSVCVNALNVSGTKGNDHRFGCARVAVR